jgi:hypothetical protein
MRSCPAYPIQTFNQKFNILLAAKDLIDAAMFLLLRSVEKMADQSLTIRRTFN